MDDELEKFVDHIIDLMNSAFDDDPEAISSLINYRVKCNEELADHPTIQCGKKDDHYTVGLLGILNGIGGVKDAWGHIAVILDDDGSIIRFDRT